MLPISHYQSIKSWEKERNADLQEVSQAEVDIPGLFRDLVVADGDVGDDGQQQRVQGVLVGLREPLPSGQLKAEHSPAQCTSS